MPAADVHHLMSALLVPRPIAWVSTRSPDGIANLAPFSWYQMVSQSPATVQVTFAGRKDGLRGDGWARSTPSTGPTWSR